MVKGKVPPKFNLFLVTPSFCSLALLLFVIIIIMDTHNVPPILATELYC